MINIQELCGWHPNPAEVNRVMSSYPFTPLMEATAPHLIGSWDGKNDVRLWEACIKVLGNNLPADKQTIGDCVSHGHARAIDYLQCVQIALGNLPNEYVEGQESAFSEAIYGLMRQRANQLSNQDGAVGAWAVDSLMKDGCPVRRGRTYDGNRAKQYGARGCPNDVATEGRSELLKQYIQVRDTNSAADLLSNGYPITVCSNQGFTMGRDFNGVCQPQGTWGHCMACIGLVLINGNRYFTILQSWGQNVPSGPTIKNMPDNSFNITDSIFQRMLSAQDSYALTSIPGFPSQELDFYV